MRVALTVDPEIPVPPTQYGGIERMVDILARGLLERGHEVTLFAHPQSTVPAALKPYRGKKSQSWRDLIRNMALVSSETLLVRHDLIHSFARLAYLLPLLPLRLPKIMSYQREISASSIRLSKAVSRRGSLSFTGCSRNLVERAGGNSQWHVIYNGVSSETYRFEGGVDGDAPLVFLGRIEEIKGPHIAVKVALQSDRRLILAGNIPRGKEDFFERQLSPHIDGDRIHYVGPIDDSMKNELLGSASALLMPILWEEPFGIVMAEALACGTPVIGFARGSVPEIVTNGANGFICETTEDMTEAVRQVGSIDRARCRAIMEERFSDRAMVTAYENLYVTLASR